MERAVTDQTPAMGPGPNMATKNKPQTTVLTERDATSMKRAMNQVAALGVVFLAARNAIGNAMKTVAAVPRVAMCTVSNSGSAISAKNSQ